MSPLRGERGTGEHHQMSHMGGGLKSAKIIHVLFHQRKEQKLGGLQSRA